MSFKPVMFSLSEIKKIAIYTTLIREKEHFHIELTKNTKIYKLRTVRNTSRK